MKKSIQIFLLFVLCLFNINLAFSQENKNQTIVFGEAQNPNGSENAFIVQQPNNAENPLGNPIIAPQAEETSISNSSSMKNNTPITQNHVNNYKNDVVPPSEAELLGNKFQNTLLEANGMVYDIQAYPTKDLNVIGDPANPETIYSPNVNP